jgi:TRAP-type mannitol/chloroaromatic compound transport system permease small subunit
VWIDLVGGIVFLVPFCIFGFWYAWPSAMQSLDIREVSPDPGGLARWPIKLMVPVAFVLLTLQGIAEIIRQALYLSRKVTALEAGLEKKTTEASP